MAKPKPTKDDLARWEAFTRTGCICCYLNGLPFRAFTRHHIVEGYRLGHRYSLPLCDWHHQGYPDKGMDELACEAIYGPSLARNKKKFIEVFGTERELCERVDALIGWEPPEWPASKVMPR